MSECNICTEKFNKSTRSIIECYCGFSCCKSCLKTYLLTIDDAECMSTTCNIVFDKKFLTKHIDKKYLTGVYKVHRETVLFNRELALLPASQLELEQIKNRELVVIKGRIISFKIQILTSFIEEIIEINRNIKKYEKIFPRKCPIIKCSNTINSDYCYKCSNNVHEYYYEHNKEYIDSLCSITNVYDLENLYTLQNTTLQKETQSIFVQENYDMILLKPLFVYLLNLVKYTQCCKVKKQLEAELNTLNLNKDSINIEAEFIRPCPNESCHGFLTHELNCKLCNCFACNDCHEVIQYGHTCNAETVETIKLLATDTKLCPGCTTPIYKINGCDNMYCIKCKVHFRWTTLKIKASIDTHNPEYLADMYRITGTNIPRDPNDILCGRELDSQFIRNLTNKCKFGKICTKSYQQYDNAIYIANILRKINTIKVQRLRQFTNNHVDKSKNLRLDYLRNIINKTVFQTTLQRNEKKYQKNESLYNILHLYVNCMIELFYKLYTDPEKYLEEFKVEIIALKTITNDELTISAAMYNTVLYVVDDEFEFINFQVSYAQRTQREQNTRIHFQYENDSDSD